MCGGVSAIDEMDERAGYRALAAAGGGKGLIGAVAGLEKGGIAGSCHGRIVKLMAAKGRSGRAEACRRRQLHHSITKREPALVEAGLDR